MSDDNLNLFGGAPTTWAAPLVLHHGDCIEWLATVPDASVDLVITDPAYESLEKHRAKGTTTRLTEKSGNAWFPIFPNARFPELLAQLYRVMKRDRHLYMMCDQETTFVVKPMAEAAGFKFWKALTWDKMSIGMGYHYRNQTEWVLFFEKGKRRLADLGISDIIQCKRVRDGYPTEKPAELVKLLLEQSSIAGEVVLDPFFGSCVVGKVARAGGRRFWGADVVLKAVDDATGHFRGVEWAERDREREEHEGGT